MPQAASSDVELRVAEVMAALSLATDLGTGQPMEQALAAVVVAVRVGEALGLDERDLADAYYVTLLRHVGCTADEHLAPAVFGDEIAFRGAYTAVEAGSPREVARTLVRATGAGEPSVRRVGMVARALATGRGFAKTQFAAHCDAAAHLTGRLGLGEGVTSAMRHAFEHWDGSGLPGLVKGEDVPLPVRLAALAQDAVIFWHLGGVEAAVAVTRERADHAYDRRLVECFCASAVTTLEGLDTTGVWEIALAAEPGTRLTLAEDGLDAAARAIADFADLKSPYTLGHSTGVAQLAEAAGHAAGLPDAECVALRRAGYLHDVGRAGVSNAVWDKLGPLSLGDWEKVRLHPYYTERILARPTALSRLGALAALHHERLDGSGYHRGSQAAQLSPSARILAAADAYHAMTEPRPHREAHSPEMAADLLRREVRAGRLEGEAVSAVLAAAGHAVRPVRREWPAGLTGREVEVLRLVARGSSIRVIARQLVIAEKTADAHIQHIYTKIGVSTRAAATLFAMQHDLLPDPAFPGAE